MKLRPIAFAKDPVIQRETIVEKIIEKAPETKIVNAPVEVTLEMYTNLRAMME